MTTTPTAAARVSGTIKAMAEAAAHLNQIAEYADMMASGHASYIGAIKRRAEATLGILAAIQPDDNLAPHTLREINEADTARGQA